MKNNENEDKKPDKKAKKISTFTQTLNKALDDKRLSVYDVMVLTALNKFADNTTGECWPTREQISEVARMKDPDAVTRCTRKLIKYGYVVLLRKGNSQRANDYKVIRDNAEVDRLAGNAPIADDVTTKKPKLKLVANNKKDPAKKQEPNDIQSAFDYWTTQATKHGMTEYNERKNKEAIKKLLDTYSLAELKSISCFIWNVWITDAKVDATNIDMGILNSAMYRVGIMNQYHEFKGWGYNEDEFENFNKQIILAEMEAVAEKENALNSPTKTDESQPEKLPRKQIR